MRLPQDRILHINTEFKDGKVNIVAEWQGELVRCKDCKHRKNICPMRYIETVGEDERIHDYSTDNGYCSWGERREDSEA